MKLSTFQANRLVIFVYNIVFSKRTWKLAFIIVSLASMYGTYHFARMTYNFRCAVNMQTVGYFTTKDGCNDLAQDKMDSIELNRQHNLSELTQ